MIGEYPVAESQADRLKATAPEARRHLRARRGVGRPVAAVGWNPRHRRQFSLRWPPRSLAAPIRRRRSTAADGSDAFLAGVVTSQVDGDGLQDRVGHQLS
jgi:hypothetical protein